MVQGLETDRQTNELRGRVGVYSSLRSQVGCQPLLGSYGWVKSIGGELGTELGAAEHSPRVKDMAVITTGSMWDSYIFLGGP